jgi:hypothetical protein
MNANDKTEKVLREIHIMLSKAEPYKPEPSRVIINKQQMIDLLAELNKCIYAMQDIVLNRCELYLLAIHSHLL